VAGLTKRESTSAAFLVADEPKLQERAISLRALNIFHDILSQPMLLDQPYPTPKALEEDARMREVCFVPFLVNSIHWT
jgi:hypothetical protein